MATVGQNQLDTSVTRSERQDQEPSTSSNRRLNEALVNLGESDQLSEEETPLLFEYLKDFLPGYRFDPSDEVLICYYLRRKIANQPLACPLISDVNLYLHHPKDLAETHKRHEPLVDEWYYFTPRERKYPNGSRPKRAAGNGYWKATGADKAVKVKGEIVGHKQALVFYEGKPPRGEKTNWIMHEFKVVEKRQKNSKHDTKLDDWVLCRIYKKTDRPSTSKNEEEEVEEAEEAEEAINRNSSLNDTSGINHQNNIEDLTFMINCNGSLVDVPETSPAMNNNGDLRNTIYQHVAETSASNHHPAMNNGYLTSMIYYNTNLIGCSSEILGNNHYPAMNENVDLTNTIYHTGNQIGCPSETNTIYHTGNLIGCSSQILGNNHYPAMNDNRDLTNTIYHTGNLIGCSSQISGNNHLPAMNNGDPTNTIYQNGNQTGYASEILWNNHHPAMMNNGNHNYGNFDMGNVLQPNLQPYFGEVAPMMNPNPVTNFAPGQNNLPGSFDYRGPLGEMFGPGYVNNNPFPVDTYVASDEASIWDMVNFDLLAEQIPM